MVHKVQVDTEEGGVELPARHKMREKYRKYTPYFSAIMMNIVQKLEDNLILASNPSYKARIKSFRSYYKKILRQHPKEAAESEDLVCLTDMMGIRVVCAFLEDMSVVLEQLKKMFEVKEIEQKGAEQSFKEFGYESIHVLVAIPDDCLPPKDAFQGLALPAGAVCEIQIRTILQDAWAEVEHELIYKTEFTPFDMPLRRKLASINASLSLADIIFQEIRDYQKKLQNEVEERRRSFYDKADDLDTVQHEELPPPPDKIGRVSPYVRGTIDDMILDAIHSHNTGDTKKAVEIYTLIIDASPRPANAVLTVIYKHRGMAYFAESDYEKALKDFYESERLDKKNFRAVYYEGIVCAILKRYDEAIECFTRSLSLNEFQSHAFYRRALAYYEVQEYSKALSDVASAKRLGMEDSACETLKKKLVDNFDMGM